MIESSYTEIELGHDVARLTLDQLAKTMLDSALATDFLIVGIRDYSITLRTGQIMRQAATRYNHGRACKVSFRRPSPRLSRAQLEQIKAMAILGATLGAQ
jgi:hypothetical protein